jgi:hypothetical protein
MYLAKLVNNGITFYLRNTVWTGDVERATRYETEIDASAAVERAKKFMARKSDAKRVQIVTE